MREDARTHLDALYDLLADEVAQRLESRRADPAPAPPTLPAAQFLAATMPADPPAAREPAEQSPLPVVTEVNEMGARLAASAVPPPAPAEDAAEEEEATAATMPTRSSYAARLMARLALGLFAVVVLINVPLNAEGTALARSVPSSASLVIRDGLLVQETQSPDVWVYRDGEFHWITSLEAFQQYGYRWENVHTVEYGFLDRFQKGAPLSVLLKCDTSPHVYALEAGQKRWIVDLATFQAEGYQWKDVRMVDCGYLRRLPAGETIPPGRGSPPPPLP